MGALPKRRISNQRRKNRRSHHALKQPALSKCSECTALRLAHNVCPKCGTYRGVQVLKV